MHEDRSRRAGLVRRIGHVGLFVALAVVPVLALNSLATADTGADPHASATDSQRECLAEQGVTLPARGLGMRSDTPAQREELRQAARACGVGGGPRAHPRLRRLTDEQRQCLADQGVTLPTRQAGGTPPTMTADQRAALRQAAETCGLPLRGPHAGGDGGGDGAGKI